MGARGAAPALIAALVTLLILPCDARAQATTVVYPTGNYPEDVERVQAAVDAGGRVVLEGTNEAGQATAFNFGPASPAGNGVDLSTDVTIVGDASGPPATIEGGVIPFFGVAHSTTRIEGLTFHGPLLSAMIFIRSTGAEILDNRIVGVVGIELFFGPTEGRGIKFLGNRDPAGAITGNVLVEGNTIVGGGADFDEGIVFDAVAADVTIRGNTTRDAAGVLVIGPGGDVTVAENDIVPGVGTGSPDQFGNGVLLLGGAPGGRYHVRDNRIVCANPFADALLLWGGSFFGAALRDTVIERNRVRVTSDWAAISLFGDVEGAVVVENVITGRASWALGVIPAFPGESATDISFVGNNVATFEATFADTVVFSHAHDTLVVGNGGSVFDIGVDTRITGSMRTRDAAGLGERVRAMSERITR